MGTHATASRQWTETTLQELVVEKHFRLRGLEMTRLDTFIDAAFAFALTLLVISFDDIPSNYVEMIGAIKQIPAFFASFTITMMFWLQHRRWSRRYGLETNRAILISLGLIFVVLVYVYPLRLIFESLFDSLSGGYLASGFQIGSTTELRGLFVYYSTGFFVMSLLSCELYRAALGSSGLLSLNSREQLETRINIYRWAISAAFGLLSILLALVLPPTWVSMAGYMYFLLVPFTALTLKQIRRKKMVKTSNSD